MSKHNKSVLQLARAQLDGGVPWGETVFGTTTLCVCQHCGGEFRVTAELEPCAFCNDCKDAVLDKLAVGLIRFAPKPRRRSKLPEARVRR